MKFTASILTLAAVAAANNMADMSLPPACAASCFTNIHQSNQCQMMDYKCLCGYASYQFHHTASLLRPRNDYMNAHPLPHSDREFVTDMATCINGACNPADA